MTGPSLAAFVAERFVVGVQRSCKIRAIVHEVINGCFRGLSPTTVAKPKDVAVRKPNKKIEAVKADAWFVYILRCSDGSLYTGVTSDVKRRSKQHNAGTASRYTRSRLPVRVEYQEPHASRSLALKREWAVKAMARLEKESLIRRAAQRSR